MYRNDTTVRIDAQNFDKIVEELRVRLTKGAALHLHVRVIPSIKQILARNIRHLRIPYEPAGAVMKKYNIASVREFVSLTELQILQTDCVGRKSLNAFKEELAICGLHFGMVFEEGT